VHDRQVQRGHALRVKLEAVGWVMVRFLRRHSLDKSNSQNHLRQHESGSGTDSDDTEMSDPAGNGGPPLSNGRAPPRSRLARDGPPSGTSSR
jgi:hypothetical protein